MTPRRGRATRVSDVTVAEGRADDEPEQFVDGTFFRRVLRSQLVVCGIIATFVVGAFKTSGVVRLFLSVIAGALSAVLGWSVIVTYVALVARRLVRRHIAS